MNTSLSILYEDNHLLIVNKPAELLTQPSGTQQDNLEERAKAWIKETYHKPGNVFLEAVHRLDKPVSGIVVFGRTSKALSRLNASMRDKHTHKTYYAIVEGVPPAETGVLENYIWHDDFQARVVDEHHPQAKWARLSYKVLQRSAHTTLLEIELDTGRYHQIRLQLQAIGCPLVGDAKYGACTLYGEKGIALHHGHLRIPHPTQGHILDIKAPLPLAFAKFYEFSIK